MKTLQRLAAHAALGISLAFTTVAAKAELAIIANPSNSLNEISVEDVERIYLGKSKSFPGGGRAAPVDQALGNPVREHFFASVLEKTEAQVTGYWSRRMFSGKGQPPETLPDGPAVKARVASDQNAIGYISDDLVDSSVKVLLLVP
jgi:ABC-type phosphate transport system substrate-binding protein